jgi:hypothetical protein
MSTRKNITPHWITRGEGHFFADQLFAIIPKLPAGWLTRKIFYLPFTVKSYAAALSYAKVLEQVRTDIQGRRYNNPLAAYGFNKEDKLIRQPVTRTEQEERMFKWLLENPYEFFESQDPLTRAHRKWFAGLLNQSWYGQTPAIRREAENTLKDLLKRPTGLEDRKVLIPSFLYLDGLIEYVHGITLVLKKNMDLPRNKRDPRIETVEDQSFNLSRKPRELTLEITAKGIGIEVDTLKAKLKEEAKLLGTPQKKHSHLVFKIRPK